MNLLIDSPDDATLAVICIKLLWPIVCLLTGDSATLLSDVNEMQFYVSELCAAECQ